ncbi:MAG TPA: hypothetical protein VG672_16875, partial [Bryobacteraceae bacterium]|nr:hypothetical protein [Bryobacteraceae bacterium]
FLLSKESYLSEATVGIQMPKEQLTDLMTQVMSRGNLKQVIEKAGLFEEERRHTPLEDVIDEMRRNIHVDPVSGSKQQTIFDVRFEYTDRVKAQKVVSALLSEFEREASSTVTAAPSLAGRSPAPVLEVLDEPNIPLRPMKPNRVMVSSASGIGGVLLAGIISLVRRRWKPVQKQSVNS